jgi:hypothetical protein
VREQKEQAITARQLPTSSEMSISASKRGKDASRMQHSTYWKMVEVMEERKGSF